MAKLWLCALMILCAVSAPAFAQSAIDAMNTDFPRASIQIQRGEERGGALPIPVEVAKTNRQLAIGLMHRDALPEEAGMLFAYPSERAGIAFWMRNTYIPLDILYINKDRVITHIHKNAKPLDETHIPAPYPTQYVLEVNAGFTEEHAIKKGDVVFLPF